MNEKRNKSTQRLFALFLCVAMLLPVLTQTVSSAGATSSSARAATPVNAAAKLSALPYSGGAGSTLLTYDCGNGVTNNGAKSCMRIIQNTTVAQFNTYCSTLAKTHTLTYTKNITSNESTKNLFRKYVAKDKTYSVYTYYLPDYDEARIIVDTNLDTMEGFKYTEQTDKTGVTPKMVMWGLSMSSTGYHYETTTPFSTNRKNNGALMIIRMRDNSLFIHDGGHLTQMSDDACDELLAFCRELTGTTGTNKKMVINCWFLSHAHDDHFQGFTRFINKNHEHFDLKNIAYNIDIERTDETRDIHDTMQLISSHYPNVRYYKPHTGETFNIAGIKFDVMYTHEDALCPNSSHKLIVKDSDSGSTYRKGLYLSSGLSDFNDTSTVLRVTFLNGVDSILYADLNMGESVLEEIYPKSAMQADIMMIPHHGFEAHPDLVKYAAAKIYLYTQNKTCIYGPDNDVMMNDMYGTWRKKMTTNFLNMFPAMKVREGVTPNVKYKIYWGGNETAIIDIKSLKNATTATAIDRCVETRDALSFEYTGWTVDSLTDDRVFQGLVSVGNLLKASTAKSTTTPLSTFVRAPQPLIQDERYLIMSDKYGYIMSYDPVSKAANGNANSAESLTRDQNGDSENTYYMSGDTVYIDHSDRENTMWVLRQYKEATGGKQIADWKKLQVRANPSFGGQAYYAGIELQKGKYGEDGVTYWTSTGGKNEYRFLCYRSDSTPFKNDADNKTQTTASARPKYILESFGNTYLLYYKASNTDYRFVYCDEYGNWGVRRYANGVSGCRPVSEIKGDLAELKIRLYKHQRNVNVKKSVAFKGYQTYYVNSSATAASVLSAIEENITVYDPGLKNLHIPCSGTTAQVGYYRLAFSRTFKPNVNGTYQVKIIYRAEANSLGAAPKDVVIGTVNVIVNN